VCPSRGSAAASSRSLLDDSVDNPAMRHDRNTDTPAAQALLFSRRFFLDGQVMPNSMAYEASRLLLLPRVTLDTSRRDMAACASSARGDGDFFRFRAERNERLALGWRTGR
jgi:hypothetical protein